VLADPTLYGEALQALPVATQLGESTAADSRSEPALTGLNRALSSGPH
jgi:hypothetical protein